MEGGGREEKGGGGKEGGRKEGGGEAKRVEGGSKEGKEEWRERVRSRYMLLHERECNIVYVAQGIDVDPRVKPEGQHQPELM